MTEMSRKFLAISDDTPECLTALTYAALRTKQVSSALVILRVARSPGPVGGWIGLDKDITQDAVDLARLKASQHADEVETRTGVMGEIQISSDEPADAIRKVIDADPGIKMLVLASGSGRGGPGPLVSRVAKGKPLASRPIAVTIIPGDMTDQQVREIAGLVS